MPRLCLNMIVRNETAILERCLASVAPHIDCYAICDTGSTDRTIDLIRSFMEARGIPGVIPTTTFRNFEQARNAALDAARSSSLEFDYVLFCDADMELVVADPAFKAGLTLPAYSVIQQAVGTELQYHNIRLVRRDFACRYRGVTHEYLDVGDVPRPILPSIHFRDHEQGANRVNKFQRDVELLTQGLRDEPGNARYMFYLASSHQHLGHHEEAIEWYERRIAAGGWLEEVFYSNYQICHCLSAMGRESEMIARVLATFEAFPHRAEPLHQLALHYQKQGRHRLAWHMASMAAGLPVPAEALFVETDVYRWRLDDIRAVSLYYLGRFAESRDLCRTVLERVPEAERARIVSNLQLAESRL
jgi:glycosyltransferase involved in cell wall biosynthesis